MFDLSAFLWRTLTNFLAEIELHHDTRRVDKLRNTAPVVLAEEVAFQHKPPRNGPFHPSRITEAGPITLIQVIKDLGMSVRGKLESFRVERLSSFSLLR